MTIHVPISEELARDLQQAFPGEQIDALVVRLLREELNRHDAKKLKRESLVEMSLRLSASMPPLSEEEFRRLRNEGRQ